MHRPGTPPRPHLFGDEGQERGEEAQQSGDGQPEGLPGRVGAGRVALVGPGLDQLHVVVGERPEPRLSAFQGPRVIEVLEGPGGFVDQVGQAGQHGPVQRVGDGHLVDGELLTGPGAEGEGESAGVEDLDGQFAAHLHLPLVNRGVGARPAVGRPVAHGVRPVAGQHVDGGDDVALGLGHLLAVRVEHPAAEGAVGPRCRVGLEVGPHRGGEQPGTDDVVTLGPEVHRVGALIEVRILLPAADDLGGERRGGPGVHHIRVADEPARRPPLGFVVASRSVGGRVDGEGVLSGG